VADRRRSDQLELIGEGLAVIRRLKDEGMTMIIATHEMAFAREVADQVCYLQDGVTVERGTPEQILTAPSSGGSSRESLRLPLTREDGRFRPTGRSR